MPVRLPPTQMSKTYKDLKKAADGMRWKAQQADILQAQFLTLQYYINKHMNKRFGGRKYNPDYPKLSKEYVRRKNKKYGPKPILVATGKLKAKVMRSKATKNKRSVRIVLNVTEYAKYLRQRGFNFVPPKTSQERKAIEKYFIRALRVLRKKRQRKVT